MRKFVSVALATVMAIGMLTGCGSSGDSSKSSDSSDKGKTEATASFDTSKDISVVSREQGSGTRGAFIELFGIEEKDSSGNKVDHTTDSAIVTNATSVMMTTVAGDEYSIGYASLGTLNDTVKALKVDGAEATADNIKSGDYKISRPFNIVTKDDKLSDVAKDFISYILSSDGQSVIEENGYIKNSDEGAYSGNKPKGKIVVAGSSSVTPVMEKLKEAYQKVNPDAEIEVQESDSTTGVTSAIEGSCDIGMASRELSDEETGKGVKATAIAIDGIAVIVNNSNTMDEITSDAVKEIFTGNVTSWKDVK